jgi:hypothetical protein
MVATSCHEHTVSLMVDGAIRAPSTTALRDFHQSAKN